MQITTQVVKKVMIDGKEVPPGGSEVHEALALALTEAFERIEEIPLDLLDEEEQSVFHSVRAALGSLSSYHNAVMQNLNLNGGNTKKSREEAQKFLEQANKDLRRRQRSAR